MSFADKVKKLIDEAPVAGFANVNYGKLKVTPLVVSWHDRQPTKTPLAEYMAEKGIEDEDDVELEKGESFQLSFDIDITEFNPAVEFHYTREVAVQASSAKVKTNWQEIVEPSLKEVFGKNWYEKILPNGKKAAPEFYVEVENADSVGGPRIDKTTGEAKKDYGCPKFLRAFKNAGECAAAREARYGKSEGSVVEEDSEGLGYPEDVLDQVRALYKSTKKNKKATMKMLESQPYGNYDAEDLFNSAVEEE